MTESLLTTHQEKTLGPRPIAGYGRGAMLTAIVRHDDRCGNGQNTFSVTGEVRTPATRRGDIEAGGCLHDDIRKVFPELAEALQYHLCSAPRADGSDAGPMHYVENTMYHLGRSGYPHAADIERARASACWSEMPEGYLLAGTLISNAAIEAALLERVPGLIEQHRAVVVGLGMVW